MPTLAEQIAPQRKQPEGLGGWLSSIADEAMGAFARYGRRSGAQRDASLALLNQAVDPNTDPLSGAAQKVLGLAGLVTHPLAFFPTGDEWRERLSNAGNNGRMGQAIGGMLGDLPSIVDPHLLAGGAGLTGAMFIGPMAKTFPHAKVPIAERLEIAGHTADDIHDMTGLHRGADGKWRAEIDDSVAVASPRLKNNAVTVPHDGAATRQTVGQHWTHPQLYEAYPQLADLKLRALYDKGGYYNKVDNEVGIGRNNEDGMESVLAHEVQHAIQDIEGWTKGADPKYAQNYVRDYWNNAGEVESRNTQHRLKWDASRRASVPWNYSQDVPTSQQTHTYSSGWIGAPQSDSPLASTITNQSPLLGKMVNKADDVGDASRGFTVFHGTGKDSADEIQRGGFKIFGGGDQDQFPIPGISTTPSKGTAQYYAAGENYLKESDRLDPVVMELRVAGDKSLFPSFDKASREYEAAGGNLADSAAFLEFLKGKGYKGVREGDEYRVFDPADITVVNTHPMQYGEDGLLK